MTAIVLLPGMDGSGALFDDFISALDAKATVVRYPPDIPQSYAELEHFVHRALPAEPYVLLGESFSGPIAIQIASRNPPTLAALVLVCTFAKPPAPRAPEPLQKLIAGFPFWRLPISLAAPALLGRFDAPPLRAKLLAAANEVLPAVWRARMRAVLSVDVMPQLAEIKVPVLYLRAQEDRIVPSSAAGLIIHANPNVNVVAIDGPHALLQVKPRECAAAIEQFARENCIDL